MHMEPNYTQNNRRMVKIIAGIAIVAVAGFAFWRLGNQDDIQQQVPEQATDTSAILVETTSTTTTVTNQRYNNGSYTSAGFYTSPAGNEEVEITLVITNDIVTDATFVGKATNGGSIRAQSLFNEGFKAEVVGKNIDEIQLDVVNGSSLTPDGFMDALAKIKAEAAIQ